MIHFMIDIENTHSSGLKGAGYLCETDHVTLFYTESCTGIEQGLLRDILQSGCGIDTCKLVKAGKNALDFYIATKVGEVFGSGYPGDIAIVSGDKGFQAISDYWRHHARPARKVIVRKDIEQCIISLDEKSERRKRIQEALLIVNLEKEIDKHKERLRIRNELEQLFAGTEQEDKIDAIMDIITGEIKPGKVLYLTTLKQFGRKNGLEIYRKLRLFDQKREA